MEIVSALIVYCINSIKNRLDEYLNFAAFFKCTIVELIGIGKQQQVSRIVFYRQILFTGYEALKLINFIGLAIGATIIIQGITLLDNFGQSEFVYNILIIIITKELGPILTAFIIIARSGTAIATELGNMVVNHEVEALDSIGIDPISYLVVPRVLGVVVSIFCLSVYFNLAGLLGGYLISTFISALSFAEFAANLINKLTFLDIITSQVKSLFFGFIVAIISCYHGLRVEYATTEVPQRTIKAVVSSLTWIIIIDILITIIVYSI